LLLVILIFSGSVTSCGLSGKRDNTERKEAKGEAAEREQEEGQGKEGDPASLRIVGEIASVYAENARTRRGRKPRARRRRGSKRKDRARRVILLPCGSLERSPRSMRWRNLFSSNVMFRAGDSDRAPLLRQ